MTTLTLKVDSIKCRNKSCFTILEQDDECFVYDYEEYCSFRCVENHLLKQGHTKKEIKTLNQKLEIYFTTVNFS